MRSAGRARGRAGRPRASCRRRAGRTWWPGDPSRRTAPSSASVATTVRESPSMRDEARVEAHPVEAVGDGQRAQAHGCPRCRARPRGSRRAAAVDLDAGQREDHQQCAAAADRGVGRVEHRPPAHRDEVDDVALAAGRARGRSGPSRLPSAPPSTRPSAIAQPGERRRRANRTMPTTTASATRVSTHVRPVASENAAPELRIRYRLTVSPQQRDALPVGSSWRRRAPWSPRRAPAPRPP